MRLHRLCLHELLRQQIQLLSAVPYLAVLQYLWYGALCKSAIGSCGPHTCCPEDARNPSACTM